MYAGVAGKTVDGGGRESSVFMSYSVCLRSEYSCVNIYPRSRVNPALPCITRKKVILSRNVFGETVRLLNDNILHNVSADVSLP